MHTWALVILLLVVLVLAGCAVEHGADRAAYPVLCGSPDEVPAAREADSLASGPTGTPADANELWT